MGSEMCIRDSFWNLSLVTWPRSLACGSIFTVSRHAASYTTNARFVAFLGTFALPAQQVWLPGNELNDPSTWVAPPLCTLKRLHQSLVQDFNCTEQPAAVLPSQPGAGGAAAGPTTAMAEAPSPTRMGN